MRAFEIPLYYRSSFISTIKNLRKDIDARKKDFSPTLLDFGSVQFLIPRHFGFCYGVENAIEIAYKAIHENPNKNIYLLSQMIHNPIVNQDLQEKGIQFIMDTDGNQIVEWDIITKDDIIIIPAFGTTIEIKEKISSIGLTSKKYNTTCPFVERVWKQSEKLGNNDFTIIIHGKHKHEETRATFSHSEKNAPSLIIKDIIEAQLLAEIILGKRELNEFETLFKERYSKNFDINQHLQKIGVVNQTTMLASETQEIADFLKNTMINKFGSEKIKNHFADTRDTLCYATNDNQQATIGLLKENADLAIVVGGYNSSNTSHIVELCEQKLPTYFINSADEIISKTTIKHYNFHSKEVIQTFNFLASKKPLKIILTSGASCPDTLVDEVLDKLLSYFTTTITKEEIIKKIHYRG
ncbi:MAG: 4-hydroxy-3-methylbut-2-enyl diphosphate reductase [Flavobacteriales bacterium CG_4_10_14_0_2_um_filter_32_8]|nr:MAG: 4-hydroxy-3-methylbut-2-enyl diphosphate reductase [Flavobacteriales bacterium CG_4_10_14_0_2_um_filter_32_8]PJB16423.1 MAG: 4-hydroxy-3-methylbut-2-enyl diphosphate reductase [Flavobacteriales bacterium CG_4_9_14_3_um_filter_32_8]